MAERGPQDINQNKINTFIKGLNKDSEPSFVNEGMWTHARNAVNNSREGDLGTLSNEPSNQYCVTSGDTMAGDKFIIGAIHLYSDKWIIFTAAHALFDSNVNINSEIGLFEEDLCRYRPIVQDACLNFDKWNLITGASREKEDCTWAIYWADSKNPDRYLNIGDPQTWPSDEYSWLGDNTYGNGFGQTLQWPNIIWKKICTDSTGSIQPSPGVWLPNHPIGCIECVNTTELDCDKIRLARLMETPCLQVTSGRAGGTLRNGSYFAVIAYSIKGQKVTDWFSPSNVQPLWFDNDPQGALEITVNADNDNFEEFILVVVANINQTAVAKQIGIYSTSTNVIYLDQIKEDLPAIPIEQIPIQTPVYEKSDQISEVNNYLLRVGPTSKFDFNYQPLANLINTEWVAVEYPAEYYINGGYKPSYMRDEVYTFFIRWVYDTGDKSASYHIPGRAAGPYTSCTGVSYPSESSPISGADQNNLFGATEKVFEVYNTFNAVGVPAGSPGSVLSDGGVIIGRGQMGYWESTEMYPDNRPDIWNSSYYCWTGATSPAYDLCGTPIRHHKFPDHGLNNTGATNLVKHYRKDPSTNQMYIRIMGVEFRNIIFPKDQDGVDIPGIVGYEILRGSREGNKSVIAKGMINNMRPYVIRGNAAATTVKGLYPNHPFNTILPVPAPGQNIAATDPYIVYNRTDQADPNSQQIFANLTDIPSNIVTFHSPDTNFKNPFLSVVELKLYGALRGVSTQQFIEPNLHPKHKLVANLAMWMMIVGGVIELIISLIGKRTINHSGAGYSRKFLTMTTGGAMTNTLTPVLYSGTSGNINTEIKFDEHEVTEFASYNATTGGQGPNDADTFLNTDLNGPNGFNTRFNTYASGGALSEALFNGTSLSDIYDDFDETGIARRGGIYTAPSFNNDLSGYQYIEGSGFEQALGTILSVVQNAHYFSEGAELTLRFIYALVPYRQYALQMIAHGFYDEFDAGMCQTNQPRRFRIDDSFYLKDTIQSVKPFLAGATTLNYRINNLKRQETVVIRTVTGAGLNQGPSFISGATADKSLVTIGTANFQLLGQGIPPAPVNFGNFRKTLPFSAQITSHYGGLKYRIVNQYGQLDSIKQIPITECEFKFDPATLVPAATVCSNPVIQKRVPDTGPLFNGDTYINRYTEKNSMFFFYDWLYGQPDGYEFNYYDRQLIPEPRFKMNTERYEVSNLWNVGLIGTPTGLSPTTLFPNSYYKLDNENYNYATDEVPPNPAGLFTIPGAYPLADGYPGLFGVKDSYMYLSTSSVRDFFVESDVLVDFREPGEAIWQKAYNPYSFTDLYRMFDMNPDVITRGNWYRYDYSLSISKLFTQYFSQGNLQSRYYNPSVAKLCYTYYPDRIIYSLPQMSEQLKDSWFIYLANNYVEFKDQISGVKNFAKTGLFITFKNSSPLVYQGIDQLQTDSGTKVTIGDGGLFAQTPQSVIIADKPYEYGSSQDLRSVISTPAGLYYVSQNQGKIFTYTNGLTEISQNGLKWWFNEFLPYKLTEDFPDYPNRDNPVAGIGCHAAYDNQNSIVYFSKRDFKLKPEFIDRIDYNLADNHFYIDGTKTVIKLGDPTYFFDASWTVSYDPKNQFWLSYHDWHPNLYIPTKNTFLTTKGNDIWRHNDTCNSFCNYYGIDYPFEVEFPIISGQTVTTTRSIEYILECYRKSQFNCVDQFHVLDYNFDQAVLYNTEQVSGYLNLNLFPKNNVSLSLQYPQIGLNSIDILFSKEENKYRFNQFWDITKDRGEFPVGSDYPPTGPLVPGTTVLQGPYNDELMWITEPNGYIKALNNANIDYQKPELQRKRFRHYINFLNLSRSVSGDVNMILKIVNSKNIISPR